VTNELFNRHNFLDSNNPRENQRRKFLGMVISLHIAVMKLQIKLQNELPIYSFNKYVNCNYVIISIYYMLIIT